jgi:hypothetical protein
MSTEESKSEGTLITADAVLAIESQATTVACAATALMEGMDSLLVRAQRTNNFTDLEVREKIEPAIRQAIEAGPRDEATPIPKAKNASEEYKLDRAFTRILRELDALLEKYRGHFDFERTSGQLREAQKLLRRGYPRGRGYQLEAPCRVLAEAWRATGRDLPHTYPKQWKRKKPPGHAFVEMIVKELWPGRSGEGLDSIIRRI